MIRASNSATQPSHEISWVRIECHIMCGLELHCHHAWLNLRRSLQRSFLVPTLSIFFACLLPRVAKAQATHSTGPAHAATIQTASRADVARFRDRVAVALRETNSERASWGILITDRDTGETLYDLNSDHFFTPASNAKLVVTALALATLGPDYKFHTTLESNADLESNGRLKGDLVLVGRGDPDISNRRIPYVVGAEHEGNVDRVLAEMADQAAARGLKQVDGDIIADDSYFPYDPYPADWTIGDIFFRFGAPVGAITFNDNMVSVEVIPASRPGELATIVTQPAAAIDSFSHEVNTAPSGGEPDLAVVREPGKDFIFLRGTIPLGHEPVFLDLSMTSPSETAALTLKQLLEAHGVKVIGAAQVRHSPPPETTASGEPVLARAQKSPDPPNTVLAEHISAPLIEVVRVTNKVSHNLHAELLLRTVGQEKFGVGSTAAGLKIEREFLQQAGIPDGDIVLSDGSGLSREDLVTPRGIVALLRYASKQPWGAQYISTLPIAGVDGTLENRMKGTPAAGRIDAKTGEVEHVRGLSGFATTVRGERLVFSMFYNNNPLKGSETAAAIDAVAKAMVETLGVPHAPAKQR